MGVEQAKGVTEAKSTIEDTKKCQDLRKQFIPRVAPGQWK